MDIQIKESRMSFDSTLSKFLFVESTEQQDFLNFTMPPNMTLTVDMMAFFTTLLTVCGLATNCITIGVLSAVIFDRMAFAVHMKILCLYNIMVLVLGSVQHNSFYLDVRRHTDDESRRYFCTYLLWFVQVVRHARTASIILILYNRIKAQSEPDVFMKAVEAVRFPVLANSLFFLVTTVYISRYIDQLDKKTLSYNRTECIFAFIRPYRRDTTSDVMVSNIPVFQHGIIITMLFIFMVKVLLRSKYIRDTPLSRSDSISSTSTEQYNHFKSWPPFRQRIRIGSDIHSMQLSSILNFSDVFLPVSNTCVYDREFGVNTMTMLIVIINTVTSGLRDAPDSFMMRDIYPHSQLLFPTFVGKCLLDLTFFGFLASMFFLMYLCCDQFRDAACHLLYNMNAANMLADSSLGMIPSDQCIQRNKLQQLSPLISPPGRHRKSSLLPLKSNEKLIVTGSVWSLDKAYFLNATRKYAIIEKF